MTGRRWPLVLTPILALVALLAWVFASPIGAGPDDDFHLISSWCAGPTAGETCEPVGEGGDHLVPEALVGISCYGGDAEQSAACQDALSWDLGDVERSDRGNFYGAYPPVYYAVTGLFTGPDVQTSALLMRVLTVLLFLGITSALYALLPLARRGTLIWGWLVTTVPLGIFLLASNNPSAWAAVGVGSSWIALLGYLETTGRRRIALGSLFVLSVLMAAGSRGDAALFAGLGIALVLVYAATRTRRFLLDAILPIVMGIVALVFFLLSRQTGAGIEGFGGSAASGPAGPVGPAETAEGLSGFGLLAYNLLNVPFIWVGNLGEWGLGWLDTSMPAVVPLAAIAAFVAVGFVGFGVMSARKAIMVCVLVLVLWLLPVYVLQQGGDIVGEQVQPRYLLPLVVLLGGVLALGVGGRVVAFTRTQRVVIAAALILANFVALHMNIRRYVTGVDDAGLNLDAGTEWWWNAPFSPMFVWIVGSIAYGALVVLLIERLARPGEAGVAPAPRVALGDGVGH